MKKFGFSALVAIACLAVAAVSFAAGPPVTASSTASATIENPVTLSTDGDFLEFGGISVPYDGLTHVEACTVEMDPDDSANPSAGLGGTLTISNTGSTCTSVTPVAHDDLWLITGSPGFAVTITNGPVTPTDLLLVAPAGGPCGGATDIPIDLWEQASSGAGTGAAYPGAEVLNATGQADYSSGATIHPWTDQCPGVYEASYDNTVFYT